MNSYSFEYKHHGNHFVIDIDKEKFDHLHFPVFSITLLKECKNSDFNLMHLFRFIGQKVSAVLELNSEGILFFIATDDEISMKKGRSLTPREFRHTLFKSAILFSKLDLSYSEMIINEDTFLTTLCLIDKSAHQKLVETEIRIIADEASK